MFAVVGTWHTDQGMRKQQAAALEGIVAGVRQSAGFLRGFWSDDIDDPSTSLTFVVFETLEQARRFRDAVESNSHNQARSGVECASLRIVEVKAAA